MELPIEYIASVQHIEVVSEDHDPLAGFADDSRRHLSPCGAAVGA